MTTTYVYLGYGTTDSNGVAKLDHDANGDEISHSYTGTGAGELDIVSSLDGPSDIDESSVQSEPYTIEDAIVYDTGVTGRDTTKWTADTGASINTTGSGTEITVSSNYKYYQSLIELTGDFEVTFQAKASAYCRLGFRNSNNKYDIWGFDTAGEWNYVRITKIDSNNTLNAQKSSDGVNWSNLTSVNKDIPSDSRYIVLSSVYTGVTFTFKNLKVMPL